MNAKVRKIVDEIERTKAKLTELQALLPELERKKTMLENEEIIKLVRSVDIAPENLPDFIEAYKAGHTGSETGGDRLPLSPAVSVARQEESLNEEN